MFIRNCWQRGLIALMIAAAMTPGQGRGQGRAVRPRAGRPPQAKTRLPQTYDEARQKMVDEEIAGAGIKNPRVIEAMRKTPRHEFMPLSQRVNAAGDITAYHDMALPIGEKQTISPPFIVAYMTEAIDPQPADKVLEIGTGSGYQAAVLSGLVREVYTIEIVESLGQSAARTLKRLHYENVYTKVGDGYQGWIEHAPFDKIIVTCSPEEVPPKLVEQLKEGGCIVIPVGLRYQQTLYRLRKKNGKMQSEILLPILFVPMTGTAEEQRKVQPNPLAPTIGNGDFEEVRGDPPQPIGWHYQRQLELVTAADAPSGKNYLIFHNAEPGRGSQALQAFGVDGRKVKALDISVQVRARNIRPGLFSEHLPVLGVTFYDENRGQIAEKTLGPWLGTFAWRVEKKQIEVPSRAREAIMRIGLFGSVGELSVDDIRLSAAK